MFKKLKEKIRNKQEKENEPLIKIIRYSNIVQYDEMGSCLRLCIVQCRDKTDREQMWIDTGDLEDDVECIWTTIERKC